VVGKGVEGGKKDTLMDGKTQDLRGRSLWGGPGTRGFSAIEALAMLAVVGIVAMLIAGVVKKRQAAGESVWSWPSGDGEVAVPYDLRAPAAGEEEGDQSGAGAAIDGGGTGGTGEGETGAGNNESGAEAGRGGPGAG